MEPQDRAAFANAYVCLLSLSLSLYPINTHQDSPVKQVAGLKEDIGLHGAQYNVLLSVMTAGYVSHNTKVEKSRYAHKYHQLCHRSDSTWHHHPEDSATDLAAVDDGSLGGPDDVHRRLQDVRADVRCSVLPGHGRGEHVLRDHVRHGVLVVSFASSAALSPLTELCVLLLKWRH